MKRKSGEEGEGEEKRENRDEGERGRGVLRKRGNGEK